MISWYFTGRLYAQFIYLKAYRVLFDATSLRACDFFLQKYQVFTTFLLCFFFPPLHSRHNFCPRSVYQPPFSLSQMALCPWNVTQSCDVTRDPPVIYSVECPERPASSFCGDDRSIECQPVYQNINVRFRHTVMTSQQYVAVACVAVPVIRKK